MPITTRDGVRLQWQEEGEGTPLLLVMGASYSSAMWYPAIPSLARHHRVISFDNRGTGGSEASREHSIESMALDALAVLDAAGVQRAHVYGVSLGGVVAQQLALMHPERVHGLVLGCTGILTPDKQRAPRWLTWLLLRLPKPVARKLRGRAYGTIVTPEARARDLAALELEKPDRVAMTAQQDALRAYSVTREEVAALTMPTLVLHGTLDPLVKLSWGEELAATIPGARLIRYEGAAHNYLVDVGEQANADVLEFLAEVDAQG